MKTAVLKGVVIGMVLVLVCHSGNAETKKKSNSEKIETRFDKQDLKYYQGIKQRLKNREAHLQKRQQSLDHSMDNKNQHQAKAQTRINHLKERLKIVANDPMASKTIQDKINLIEGRIQKRAERIKVLEGKKLTVESKLTQVHADLDTVQTAIDAKKQELHPVAQQENQESTGSL